MTHFINATIVSLSVLGVLAFPMNSENDSSLKELSVGDVAPNWTLTGSDDKQYSLSDYKGKQAVVVSWYPAALTGG